MLIYERKNQYQKSGIPDFFLGYFFRIHQGDFEEREEDFSANLVGVLYKTSEGFQVVLIFPTPVPPV